MKRIVVALAAIVLTVALVPESDAARRLGGGKNLGAQRPAGAMQRQATPPAATPQQGQQAAAAQQAGPGAKGQPPAAQGNRWLGPLAGLAAGLGLGWLLSQGGMGGLLGTLLLAMVIGFVVMMLIRAFARRPAPQSQPVQYAGLGNETVAAPPPSQIPYGDDTPRSAPQVSAQPKLPAQPQAPELPAGFDADGFLRQARRYFVQLQEANDRADLSLLREFTTDGMFESLKGDIVARGTSSQQTEIVTLEASLLELTSEAAAHWASVRFFGTLRESPQATPEAFEEVWHLSKPLDGESGWLLAGIQQVS